MVKTYRGYWEPPASNWGRSHISYSSILILAIAIVFMVLLYLLVASPKLEKPCARLGG